ncbi:tetratricopeptide repeat protein [Dawidia soli]|uniref:Tetratricopeptide repeat protein n=1 Tax=Dawidia soli TaxID=2782352 RepID=A0AAP2GDE2_9BACT|nr:tetratricopeptide repeat protein [Dawidia soli]MBT1687259.1 tetratricopeptide repeat protein [Dawidia soli]
MNRVVLQFTVSIVFFCCPTKENKAQTMTRYFTHEEFVSNFQKEMVSAQDVYNQFKKNGLTDNALGTFDIVYISDSKKKLDSLGGFLTQNYGFKMKSSAKAGDHWEMAGDTKPIPVDLENLLYWALDLYVKGFAFDCRLDGYGAMMDHRKPEFLKMDPTLEVHYFKAGLDAYNKRDLGSAIINWTLVTKINPNDPNAYYSRAIAKNELHTWKSALRDYDKAIELAPNFVDAIVNRAALKDNNGDYKGAMEDYNRAIELKTDNPVAYFNRGNTHLNLGDKKLACADWSKAKELGSQSADERMKEHCH